MLQGNGYIFLIAIIAIFYFMILRPQMKEKKETQKMLESLKKGDKVLLNSGMYGEVNAVKDNSKITLKIAENVKVDFTKSSIAKVITKDDPVKA